MHMYTGWGISLFGFELSSNVLASFLVYLQLTRPAGNAVTNACFVITHGIVATLTGILAVQSPTIVITACKYQSH